MLHYLTRNIIRRKLNHLISVATTTVKMLTSDAEKLKCKITKLESRHFDDICSDGLKSVKSIFDKYNYEIRIAGGAVRDLLMDIKPHDIDLATNATPNQMVDMFDKEEVRMINTNGLSHGTVTCRICEENFEITTLRIDKVTDGRRAEVEFTNDWGVDSSRRDFTVNSLFLDFDANIYDYFNGVEHLQKRLVTFVKDPVTRIQEDYLRILRYFRFFARISDENASHDEHTLNCIKENTSGLHHIAGERLWFELNQIFNGRLMVKSVAAMHKCGVLSCIGFPEDVDIDYFEQKFKATQHLSAHHMTFVSALLRDVKDLERLEKRVKFSKKEREIAVFIVLFRDAVPATEPQKDKCYKDIIVDNIKKIQNAQWHVCELLKYKGDFETLITIADWKIPAFPVSGKDIMSSGLGKGKAVGMYLDILKQEWKKSTYTATKEQLLEKAKECQNTQTKT